MGASLRREAACILWEPRRLGDGLWFRGLIATGASLLRGVNLQLQGATLPFVGAPPPGRCVVVCAAYRDGGVAPTKKLLAKIIGRFQQV